MEHKSLRQWRAEKFRVAQTNRQREIPTEYFRFPRNAGITQKTIRALMLTIKPAWGELTYRTTKTRRYFLVMIYDCPEMSAVLRQWIIMEHGQV